MLVTKLLLAGILSLMVSDVSTPALATSSPCAPGDPKPTKTETRLGTIAIDTDVVAVGQPLTILVHTPGPMAQVTIAKPANTELVDFTPRTISGVRVTEGSWSQGDVPVPAGDYSLTVKPTAWTNSKWVPVRYSVQNEQGVGTGQDAYFAFYDKVPFTLSLDDRNQVVQTTKSVLRRLTVDAPAGIGLTLALDKGTIGTDISQKRGTQATQTVPPTGKATYFATVDEGAKVTFTASSTDTCTDSTTKQLFTIVQSTVANQYKEPTIFVRYWWAFLLLIVGLIALIWSKRRKIPTQPDSTPIVTQKPTLQPPLPAPPSTPNGATDTTTISK